MNLQNVFRKFMGVSGQAYSEFWLPLSIGRSNSKPYPPVSTFKSYLLNNNSLWPESTTFLVLLSIPLSQRGSWGGKKVVWAHKSYWLVAERPCWLSFATILASIYSVAALPAIVCQENPGPLGCSLMSCLSYPAQNSKKNHTRTDQH